MNENPYQSPGQTLPPDRLILPQRGRGLAVVTLVLLLLGSLASSAVVVVLARGLGMLSASGTADPTDLARAVSGVLGITMVGMALTLAGGALGSMILFGQGNRERWFLVLGSFVFVLQLGTLPLGTPIGILLLCALFLRRNEFRPGHAAGSANVSPMS